MQTTLPYQAVLSEPPCFPRDTVGHPYMSLSRNWWDLISRWCMVRLTSGWTPGRKSCFLVFGQRTVLVYHMGDVVFGIA